MSLPQPITPGTGEAQLAEVIGVAMALSRGGRNDQALPILGQLATLHPGRSDVRLAHVAALGDQGRTLEALAQLSALKPMGVTPALMAAIQVQAEMAIVKFNAHLARGEPADAERFAAALAELMPQNPAMLQAALSCNQALGRTAQALHYAQAMLAVDPANRAARTTLADLLHAHGDIGREIDHRVALALAPAPDTPALLALRDLHDAAGLILCRPLTAQSRAQLDALLSAAKALEVPVPPGTDWEAWA
ncbi:MAG TPA: hypothetical protein VHV27_03640, partial [Phenylobacterium sp.]|nr:hypothetical protein [Phenylobacterium sp.]